MPADLVDGVAEQPPVKRREPLLQPPVLVHRALLPLRHRLLECPEPAVDQVQVTGASGEMLAHGQAGIRRLLGEIADAVAGVGLDRAAIGLRDAGEDAEQRRLPGTVRADQAYAVAVTEDE